MNQSKLNTFVERARKIHGDRYDYSGVYYVNSKTKVTITCPEHGSFLQSPEKHILSRTKCPACAGRPIITTSTFISRAKTIHGDRYSYEHAVYVNDRTKLQIICRKHGPFLQSPGHHIHAKQGCPTCKLEKRHPGHVGGYSLETIPDHLRGRFYCVVVQDEDQRYVKIGITKNNISRRLAGIGTVITQTELTGKLRDMYLLEQLVLANLADIRYKFRPTNKFARFGWTECFRHSDLQRIMDTISKLSTLGSTID